jgi:hypothetical protein
MSDFDVDQDERDLSKILCIKDKNGRVAVTLGLVVTVFFESPGTRGTREAIVELAERYINEFRGHLKWASHPESSKMHPIDSGEVPFPREWLLTLEDGKAWGVGFHSGDRKLAAGSFQIDAYGSETTGMGYYHVSLPLDFFAENPGTLPEYVRTICHRIGPLSGYAGIGVIEPLDILARKEFQPAVRSIAERFPGLEIENRTTHTIHLKEGIKGVNWLTILGSKWIAEMGGIDYLRGCLNDSVIFSPYGEGLIIQAGPKPQIGDVTANRWPQHYVALAKVLKRIQIKNHYPFHFGGPGRLDYEASLAWLFRFDKK